MMILKMLTWPFVLILIALAYADAYLFEDSEWNEVPKVFA